ncbi:hypothetical protein ACMGGR_18865 [Erwinia sp. BNK-24-b]|uniref:hypothetical protein n=1 Tax=Erwinia TaxID=551 RepID=UPI001FEE5CEE|nr:hypothetical protein [Erwinia phyllosphaerae]MBV4368115.1 hypothetical protein [Erwinia phyllosphaerae]
MKKLSVAFSLLLLCGCVDMGRVGMHPELKSFYLDGSPHEVAGCLYSAASHQHLFLERDDPLPGGTRRYKLKDTDNEDVAWVEISSAPHKQSHVNVYQAREADVRTAVSAMVARCQ